MEKHLHIDHIRFQSTSWNCENEWKNIRRQQPKPNMQILWNFELNRSGLPAILSPNSVERDGERERHGGNKRRAKNLHGNFHSLISIFFCTPFAVYLPFFSNVKRQLEAKLLIATIWMYIRSHVMLAGSSRNASANDFWIWFFPFKVRVNWGVGMCHKSLRCFWQFDSTNSIPSCVVDYLAIPIFLFISTKCQWSVVIGPHNRLIYTNLCSSMKMWMQIYSD